ncbi:hypothetical protein GCM10007276_16020 [Agaricicola taiwanensis]|uniref:Uncharacterized protein n=1 Tax=Agaricicola taiwanensis TaxID=591372 RepID=A0A8J2VN20_9RHOB|nr:hypothetical protein [Agaricicola taiwanensis]GGE39476.1 hypothetical protein GCM10007276_16020 [Agaricicola taiwanensis]
MIDIFLHVMLGFLAASCLALAGGRMLWSRAVRLTTRRLENQLPSSVGEIVAAQDMIRAESAIRIRALERTVSSLRAKLVVAEAAAASSDTERTRYALDHSEKATIIAAMETRIAALEEQLSEAQGSGAEAVAARDKAREEFAALRKKLDADSRALAEARVELNAQKVRLVAMDVETANMRSDRDNGRSELARSANRLEEAEGKLKTALERCDELSAQLKAATAETTDNSSRLTDLKKQYDRQTAELGDIRKALAEATASAEALKAELAERSAHVDKSRAARDILDRKLFEAETALKAADERSMRDAKRADRLAEELEEAKNSRGEWKRRAEVAETERNELARKLPAEMKALERKSVEREAAYAAETKRLEAALNRATKEHAKARAAEARAVERVKALSQELLAAQNGPDGQAILEGELAKVRTEKAVLEAQLASARAEWSKVERHIQRSVEAGPDASGKSGNAVLRARLDMLADEIALFAGAELPPASGLVTPLPSRAETTVVPLAKGTETARTRNPVGAAG